MKSLKVKGRTFKYGPHTSVILPALGSLSSVALSSGRININYMIKKVLQLFFDDINILAGGKNGNFNCRCGVIIIVVDQQRKNHKKVVEKGGEKL